MSFSNDDLHVKADGPLALLRKVCLVRIEVTPDGDPVFHESASHEDLDKLTAAVMLKAQPTRVFMPVVRAQADARCWSHDARTPAAEIAAPPSTTCHSCPEVERGCAARLALLVACRVGNGRRVYRIDISGPSIVAVGRHLDGRAPCTVEADLVLTKTDAQMEPTVAAQSVKRVPCHERSVLLTMHNVALAYAEMPAAPVLMPKARVK